MATFEKYITTRLFGEVKITINEDWDSCHFVTIYNGQEIEVRFVDYSFYGDKIKAFIDKYIQINEIAKKAIIENFPYKRGYEPSYEGGFVNYYFKSIFEKFGNKKLMKYYHVKKKLGDKKLMKIFGVKDFNKLDIQKTIDKLGYPKLMFTFREYNQIILHIKYWVSEDYLDLWDLRVRMNEELNVLGFETNRSDLRPNNY